MKRLAVAFVLVCVVLGECLASAHRRENHVLLNGDWELAIGQGDEEAQLPHGQEKLKWKPVTLPGLLGWQEKDWKSGLPKTLGCVWVRRQFEVPTDRAEQLAVLRWNYIRFGAVAYINGQEVGRNVPTGPYQTLLPGGTLKPGKNTIVLKIHGPGTVPKGASGFWLIPCGFSNESRRGLPAFSGDIWIDFARGAYLKWILAIPDLANQAVRIRVTPVGPEELKDLTVRATVRAWPDGDPMGTGQAAASALVTDDPLGGEHFFLDVPMPGFKPWTYEQRNLYTADVKLTRGNQVLDVVSIRFGMREIKVADGNYKLNGRNLWLRGSNLIGSGHWAGFPKESTLPYLVTEAREMSMNSFRTHTVPPSSEWADIADEHGTMFLAEFPVLYNNKNFKLTPQEYAIWHRNCMVDAAGWMSDLWNHPSVIMWVLSNESHYDTPWETGPFRDFVLGMDPTRPTMRTGDHAGTAENYDVHPIGNISSWTEEGRFLRSIKSWMRHAQPRTLTCTEYMNNYAHGVRWTGIDDKQADRLACAQLGMEHTEAMRRHRIDGIFPFAYGGWTKTRTDKVWKAGFAKPLSAAWHSSLSPVLASLDLFNPNYLTGQKVVTDLCLINETHETVKVDVDLLLTRENPELIPEAACFENPLAGWSYEFELAPDSLIKAPVTWALPQREGNYWLTARTTGMEGRPVLSQRFVRAIEPVEISDQVGERTFVVLGSDEEAVSYFKWKRPRRPLRTTRTLEDLKVGEHVVIIWNASLLMAEEKAGAEKLCAFAAAGGQVVVLDAYRWDWPELADVSVKWVGKKWGASRAFFTDQVQHPLLAGIDPQWLIRWNGLPGRVASRSIEGDVMARARPLVWAVTPQQIVVAQVPAASGTGTILFVQLAIRDAISTSLGRFDPVADRILANVLGL